MCNTDKIDMYRPKIKLKQIWIQFYCIKIYWKYIYKWEGIYIYGCSLMQGYSYRKSIENWIN